VGFSGGGRVRWDIEVVKDDGGAQRCGKVAEAPTGARGGRGQSGEGAGGQSNDMSKLEVEERGRRWREEEDDVVPHPHGWECAIPLWCDPFIQVLVGNSVKLLTSEFSCGVEVRRIAVYRALCCSSCRTLPKLCIAH
jgi:hypothetical protein